MGKSDLKISQLTAASALDGSEIIPFAKGSDNSSAKVSLLKTFITSGLAKQTSVDAKQDKLKAGSGVTISASNEISVSVDLSAYLKSAEAATTYAKKTDIPSVDLAPYLKSADAATTYAKKTEIPDVSGFVKSSTVTALAEQVAALQTTVADLQAKIEELTANTESSE